MMVSLLDMKEVHDLIVLPFFNFLGPGQERKTSRPPLFEKNYQAYMKPEEAAD